ncbi:putative RTA1 domain protein [Diaporthe sp. PMI_573]|nr:putative RTA1 domain protein [Diaporthaceae sp. PMI_573]
MDIVFNQHPNGTFDIEYFQYTPSKEAGLSFMVIFAAAGVAHIGYMFFFRAWSFIPMILGGICEIFGYYGRFKAHSEPDKIGPWIMQAMLLLCAPPLLAGSIYMSLGRLITALDASRFSMIRPTILTKIYVLIDVLAFFSQLAGVGVQASGDAHLMAIGKKCILGGLIFQEVALLFFTYIAVRVQNKLSREPTDVALGIGHVLRWRRYFAVMYVATVLLIVRNMIRLVEFAQGPKGTIASNEAFIYVFDAVPMALVMVAPLVFYPARLTRVALNSEYKVVE